MNQKELNSFKLSDAVTFHDKLNPKLWNGTKLRTEVRDQLIKIAEDFLSELGVHDLDVKDITISGSNAAYSYTKHSDLDLHILVDMGNLPVDEVYKELFNAKKTIYNDSHDITIHTIPVELYVQDSRQPVVSLGEYSVMNDQWIRIPTKRRSDFDQTATKSKYEKLLSLIEMALKSRKYSKVKHIIDTIKRYRQAGLDKGGEFGPENLAYKMLRSQGYITKLYDLRDKLHSEKLSFETMYQNIDENLDLTSLNRDVEKIKQSDSPIITPLQEINGYFYSAYMKIHKQSEHIQWIIIECKTKSGKQVGLAEFVPHFSTKIIIADKVVVHKKYQNQGIASTMYAYAKMLGFDVVRSDEQTTAGKKMWKAFDKSGAAKQLYHNSNGPITRKNDEFNQIPEGIVDEAFDTPLPITWEKGEHGDVDALAKLPDGTNLSIMFNKQDNIKPDDKTWMVEFYRNNSQEVTGEGDAQKVFSTVLTAIQQFIKKYKPLKIYFSASKEVEPGQNAESRSKLYDRLVLRYAKSLGYKFFRADNGSSVMYQLSRIPKQKAVDEDYTMQFAAEKTPVVSPYAGVKDNQYRGGISEASGYIPSEKQKNDPRYSTALTVDVHPDSIKKNAKAFYWNTSRAGIPPTAKANGKIY